MLFVSLVHAVAAILLAVYGANALLLAILYLRRRQERPPEPPTPTEWPAVTVQLPVFNELHVVERLIDAVAAMDYPRDRFQVQVLDDSIDETTALAMACIDRHRAQGVNIELLHRVQRPGFKAGALAAAQPQATGEFIAIFDADFVPQPDFLRRTVPPLYDDSNIGDVEDYRRFSTARKMRWFATSGELWYTVSTVSPHSSEDRAPASGAGCAGSSPAGGTNASRAAASCMVNPASGRFCFVQGVFSKCGGVPWWSPRRAGARPCP